MFILVIIYEEIKIVDNKLHEFSESDQRWPLPDWVS